MSPLSALANVASGSLSRPGFRGDRVCWFPLFNVCVPAQPGPSSALAESALSSNSVRQPPLRHELAKPVDVLGGDRSDRRRRAELRQQVPPGRVPVVAQRRRRALPVVGDVPEPLDARILEGDDRIAACGGRPRCSREDRRQRILGLSRREPAGTRLRTVTGAPDRRTSRRHSTRRLDVRRTQHPLVPTVRVTPQHVPAPPARRALDLEVSRGAHPLHVGNTIGNSPLCATASFGSRPMGRGGFEPPRDGL